MQRNGACHCESVQFRAETDLDDVVCCNCSFCSKRGALLQKMPASKFSLLRGEGCLQKYGKRSFSSHYFCSHCGVHVFTHSARDGEDAIIVNIACIAGVDVTEFTPRRFDGATLL